MDLLKISIHTKVLVPVSFFLYGSETWKTTDQDKKDN